MAGVPVPGGAGPADLVLTNGVVYTPDRRSGAASARPDRRSGGVSARPDRRDPDPHDRPGRVAVDPSVGRARAVAIRDGRIAAVGVAGDVAALIGRSTRVVDVRGATILPGFIDAHAHVSAGVSLLYEARLFGEQREAYPGVLREFVAQHPRAAAVRGAGWNAILFDALGPRKEELDAIDATRPMAIVDQDGHALWVNSKSLELAGIGRDTSDPPGGVIERDAETGEPSGTLRETAADLVTARLPDYTPAEYARGIEAFQRDVAGPLGITAAFDPAVAVGGPAAQAYENLARDGGLTLTVRAALHLTPSDPLEAWLESAVAERAAHVSSLFQTPSVKFFADGVLEGRTAYLCESYADRPGFRGTPLWPPAELSAAFAAVDAAGFQIHVHCIGDAATSEVLDALQALETARGRADRRPGITHLQCVAAGACRRLAALGVTAVVQPYWAVKDDYFFDSQLPALGRRRAEHEYPIRSFFDAGALVASASDWPVTMPPDPLDAIQIGVTRRFAGLSLVDEPLWPDEKCTPRQMIDSFTANAARAMFLDDETGSVETGKSADLIVVDRDLVNVAPDEIGEACVLLTLFRGQEVFRAASF